MFNWLKRLMGGSDSSASSEPAEPMTASEPESMPAESPAEPSADMGASSEGPAGDEPA